jgi:hypothetical protein
VAPRRLQIRPDPDRDLRRVGITDPTAVQWAKLAARDWSNYVAKTADPQPIDTARTNLVRNNAGPPTGPFRVHESSTRLPMGHRREELLVMAAKQRRSRGQTVTCAWCRRSFPLLATGRFPKYCGDTCRHRAWEQHRRAIDLDRVPVEVVVQRVQVETTTGSELAGRRNGAGWTEALAELSRDLDRGRVYDRDLRALAEQLQQVLQALERRPGWARLSR